jgi:ferric-dicitrate binding protein FerR (iron transport regulator)
MACDQKTMELLSVFVDGEATPEEAARAEAHLGVCSECRATVQEWRHGLEMLDWAYSRALPENIAEPVFEPPASIPEQRKRRSFQWPSLRVFAPAMVLAALIFIGVFVIQHIRQPVLGRQLATAGTNQTVLVAKGIRLEILPNSEVTRLGEKAINLIEGDIKIKVTHAGGLVVKTRRLQIIDQGTKFEVHSDAKADSITVEEGRVLVRQGEKEYHVNAGEVLSATGDAAKIEQRRNGKMHSLPMPTVLSALFFLLAVVLLAFWVQMLVDCLKREFKDSSSKIAWVLVILLGHLLGALVYNHVVFTPARRTQRQRA